MAQPYDMVIIGGGSAGLTAADFARQLGRRVALVEQGRLGGDCTWPGCIPSRALLGMQPGRPRDAPRRPLRTVCRRTGD